MGLQVPNADIMRKVAKCKAAVDARLHMRTPTRNFLCSKDNLETLWAEFLKGRTILVASDSLAQSIDARALRSENCRWVGHSARPGAGQRRRRSQM